MINYSVDQQVAIITWAMTSSPMNVLNDESIPAFDAALQRAYADDSINGIIITSNKPEFVAGADLKMILRNNDKDPVDMLPLSLELNRIFRSIETVGKPTVAAINGTVLGGGYEICLACHHRITLNNPKTLIGLVEVTIGLLPGAGGTQRLPRMVGFQTALPLILEGKKVGVQEANRLGMIDDTADNLAEMMEKAHAWIAANPKPVKPWDEVDRKTGRIVGRDRFTPPGGDVQSTAGAQTFSTGTAMLMAKTRGNYPAPLDIMACVYEGLQVNIDQALVIEARHFAKVATSKVARNLIQTMFLGLNEVNKGIRRPKDIPKTDVKKMGILGADLSSVEVAYVSALAGIEVILSHASVEATERVKNRLQQLLEKDVERSPLDAQKAEYVLSFIQSTDDTQGLNECDLVIENNAHGQDLAGQSVISVNALVMPGSKFAETAAYPGQVVGIRFVAPVAKGRLVEVVAGNQTSDHALAVAMDYVRKIKRTPIVVSDSPGGYVSRGLAAYSDEGQQLLQEGVNPVLIENGGKMAGMPTGPLAVLNDPLPNSTQKAVGQPTLNEIKTRLLYRQSIEAVRCFEMNIVTTKLEADLGSILGWGFPTYTGGALSFIDFVGLKTFVNTSDRLADTYGERFRPTDKLRKLSALSSGNVD